MARRGGKVGKVPGAELAVLQVLWRDGERAVRELAEALYGDGGASACATVQKLLERLEAKGLVRAERGARPFRFEAAVGREELVGRELAALAESLCGGSFAPLVSHLMEHAPLGAEELAALRARLQGGAQPPRKKRRSEGG